jgi:hypothetical protein
MEKKQHLRWTRRGAQMLLHARCALLNGELGKYTRWSASESSHRFLKVDSEVFRSRTPGEPFDGAQRNRGLFTIFSDAPTMMFQRMFPPGWSHAPANHKGGISVKTPRFFPVPI